MKTKKIVFALLSLTLIFILTISSIKDINAKKIINEEISTLSADSGVMDVTFTENGKTSVTLTDDTTYEGWNYQNIAKLSISLSELDTNVVYKLIISMDNAIYLPVDILPSPDGALTRFEKNEAIVVNGIDEYEGMPFSGTITYTFNSESTKTVEIDNFELELKYDEVLWNNLANAHLGDGIDPVISVKLISEDVNVLSEKNIVDITSEIRGTHNFDSSFSCNNNIGANNIKARPSDTIKFSIKDGSPYRYTGQYFKQVNIDLTIPSYTTSDNTYYLQYDESNIKVYTSQNVELSKEYYNLILSEDKISVQLNDFYLDSTGYLLRVEFYAPQEDALLNTPGLYSFKGSCVTYIDANPNSSLFVSEEIFNITLNTNPESQLGFYYANSTIDYRNDNVVQPLGGLGITNTGGDSGKIKLVYDFDTDLTDENKILVTSIRLLPDNTTKYFELKYSLVDEDGNTIYFDSAGNIVPEGTPDATSYWSVLVKNIHYNKTLYFYSSVLFYRENLIEAHRNYYFKTIEYVISGLAGGKTLWHSSANFSYTSSSGTFWGYAKMNGINKNVTSNIKVYEENNDMFELKYEKNILTKSTQVDEVAYGLLSGSVSANNINAGNSFSVTGNISTISYPYSANNILNTADNNLILGFKLPEGITINESGSKITDKSGEITINIINITSTPVGDGYNFWTIEIEGGHLIGYCSEKLGAISTGSTIKFNIEFNTSLVTVGTTLYIRDTIFVGAKGIKNKATGTYQDMNTIDIFDLNGNGDTTDGIGCFSSSNNETKVQIIGTNATLDIYDSLVVNGNDTDTENGNLENLANSIIYELEINCTVGGIAEDFAYYIPIVKKNSIVDNELIFNAVYSLKLDQLPVVINSVEGYGVKLLYCFDPNVTYGSVDSVTWYDSISEIQRSGQSLSDVTLVKIVSEDSKIENGSVSIVRLTMSYDGEEEDYSKDAGLSNSWTSRGQYKFIIGDRGASGHYSTDTNNLSVNYTFDQQVIELTTTTGDHTDDIGNDSYTLDILETFKKEQTYKIISITTYNTVLTTVETMEANAHLYTGDDANRTFAFYTTLDTNEKKDLTIVDTILGTVSQETEFTLNFEIFNADVISDITTIRYIDVIIESDNGVTIPVRINIKRELTAIGTVSNSISSGKQYTLFGTTQTEIELSKDSSFTAQFSAENIFPNNYKGRKIVFETVLPVSTTIVLIDLTYTNDIKYYMYKISSSDTNIIDLTKFKVMGSSSNYTVTTGNDAITEKYLFIIDLPDDNTLANDTKNSINLARTLNSGVEEMSDEALKFTTKAIREYELESTDNIEIGEEIEVEYTVSEIEYSDSKYNDRKLALSIKPTSTMPIYDSSIEYNGNTYYLNSKNEFIIPLDDVQLSGTYSIKFIYNSETIKNNNTTCDLNIKLIASATSNAEKPHLGEVLKEISINIVSKEKPSLKVENMSDRWLSSEDLKDTLEIKYNAINVTGKVTIELQTKVGEGYITDSTLLEAVNGSTIQTSGKFTVTGVYTLNLKFSQLMPSGNYQILFTVYDSLGNVERTVAYKFVVVNG